MSDANDSFGLVGHVLAQKYRVDSVVGEGGFGVVYRGFHLSFRHDIAVKCLRIPIEFAPDAQADFVARFRDEGQHLSRLASAHMSIVRVFDFDIATSPNGVTMPYLVLEWLDGKPLDVVVAERGAAGLPCFDEREALRLLRPAVEALAVAHELGIVHRDVKPANLFVAQNPSPTIKVLDFGVAQATTGEAPRKTTGFNPFSPLHGSPEQFSPKKFGATGPWTDVHALGLVLVEMVTGKHPLGDDDVGEMFLAATSEPRPTPRARGARVSDAFEAMCAGALARIPQERFSNARALLAAMDAVAAGGEIAPAPTLRDPPTDPSADTLAAPGAAARTHGDKDLTSPHIPAWVPPRQSRWRRLRAGALVAGVLVVAAAGTLGWLGYRRHVLVREKEQCASGDLHACKEACDRGHTASCGVVARRLLAGDAAPGDEASAVALLRRACSPLDPKACGPLGAAYEQGRGGLGKDERRAAELYQRACAADEPASCVALGLLLERAGGGLTRDDKRAAELYQRACDQGSLLGCAALGRATDKGSGGVPKDASRAVALYQRACDGGELLGCNGLGYAYERGVGGLAKDPRRGVDLYRRACDGGVLRGCTNLGYAYEHAIGGVPKDPRRAVPLYRRACDGGDAGACANLGVDTERGTGGLAKDEKRAVELYRRACDGGALEGCSNLGFSYERGIGGLPKDEKHAAELYERACDDAAPDGCNNLAVFYEHAEGAQRDEKRAAELYGRACEGGSMIACSNLGFQYEHAKGGLARDGAKAAELYRRACDGGEADGCNRLGVAYEQGKDAMPRDAARAVELYRRACDGGSTTACYHLGVDYQQGKGGLPVSAPRAVELYRRACDDAVAAACQGLGLAYERGTGGLAPDKTRAAELYQRACTGGLQAGCDAAKRLGAAPRR